MRIKKHIVIFLFTTLLPFIFSAQTEAEMKTQADVLFDSEKYVDATPLYLRLLSLQPRDYVYNYKYGTCVLFNSNNKQDAIKYLSFAVNEPTITPDAYYFLGKALHYNYQFNEAIKQYSTYLEKRTGNGKQYDAEREIQMCQNGKRLMTTITDIIVYDKKEITSDKFFRIYDLKDIGGNLLVTADFQTKTDKKYNHIPLIHFPQKPTVIYYSSYGDNASRGKEIFVRRKLPDGSWGMPQPIPGNVNTEFDEDFPYMHPDGNYLYFSSKGHNSMGGYDVFRSKFDAENNTFGPPENIDFAISSPDDDMFYVVDSLNKNAYFASARQSQTGKLYVYKVNVDRVPIQLSVIKGNFVSEIDPENKKINFEIKDYSNGEAIGKFNSNDKSVYLITFPKGGKYEYIMTLPGVDKEFRTIVSIPFLKEFKPLKQKIIHKIDENGRETVQIINLFNEEVEDPQSVIAEVIKLRSGLEVNVDEFDMTAIEQDKKNKEILNELGLGNLLLVEVSDVLKQNIDKGAENKDLINSIGNNINNLVVENAADFVRLEEQIKSKVAEANKTQNTESKYILFKEAEGLIKKQQELKKYSKEMLQLNDSIRNVLASSAGSSDQKQLQDIKSKFDQLMVAGQEKEALQLIAENKDFILNVMNDNSTDLVQNLVDKVVKYDEETSALKDKVDGYNRDMKDLEIEIQSLQNSIFSAKKKDVPAIEAKIATKKEELKMIEEERNAVQKVIDTKTQEKFQVNKQIQILQDAISNKSIATVSKEQANKAIAQTEKTNSNTLTAYVDQQIQELERQDPTLKERIVVSSGLRAQNIYQDYESSSKGIQDDPSLSKEDRLYKLLANERNTLKLLDKRLSEIEELRVDNEADESLNREKIALLKYQKEIDAKIEAHNKQVEVLMAENGSKDPEELINSIQPGYEDNKKYIESNSNLSQNEKLKSLNEEDEKLITSVDKELAEVNAKLEKNPSDKVLKQEQSQLIKIKENTTAVIDQRNTELASIPEETKGQTTEELINGLDSKYVNRKDAIATNRNLDSQEKIDALNREDEKFIESIDKELKTISSELAKDPADKKLLAKETQLKELKESTENAIKERKNNSTPALTQITSEDKEDKIKELDPQYSANSAGIEANNALSREDQIKEKIKLDKELQVKISDQIAVVEKQLENDPSNRGLQRTNEILQAIKKENESKIASLEQELENINDNEVSADTKLLTDQIVPGYSSEVEKINNDKTISAEDKMTQLQLKDKELLASIDVKLASLDKEIQNDPTNEKLISEKAKLNELRALTESKMEEREQIIDSELTSKLTKENLEEQKNIVRSTIDPSYAKKKEAIIKSNKDELTKKEEELKLEARLLQKIEEEEIITRKTLGTNPFDKTAKTKALVLYELKKESLGNSEELKKEIELINKGIPSDKVTEAEQELAVKELAPEYSNNLKTISEAKDLSEKEKAKQLIIEEQELIKAVDEKQESIKEQLKLNPANKTLEKENRVLNAIKEEAKERITEQEKILNKVEEIPVVSEEQKEAKISEVNPQYNEVIKAIDENQDLSTKEKLEQKQVEDQKLLDQVYDSQEKNENELTEDPSSAELKNEKNVLNAVATELESRIEERQVEINNSAEEVSISEAIKKEKISMLHPSYSDDVAVIGRMDLPEEEKLQKFQNEDILLLSKVNNALVDIEEILMNDPTNAAKLKEKNVLEAIQKDLQKTIEERNKQMEELKGSQEITSAQKTERIEKVDPAYLSSVEAIKSNNELGEQEKTKELLKTENEFLDKVTTEKMDVQQQLNEEPENTNLRKDLATLESIQRETEAIIAEHKSAINENEQPIESKITEERMVTEIFPDYETRKETLASSKMPENKKVDEQIKLENELLTKLTAEEKALQKMLLKDPENVELKQKIAVIQQLINKQNERKSELLAQQKEIEAKIRQTEVLSQVDEKYSSDVEQLKASTSETKNNDLIEREEVHQERINAEIEANEKLLAKKDNPVIKEENETLKNELVESQKREEEYKGSSVEPIDNTAKKEQYVGNLREDLLKENADVMSKDVQELEQLKEQDQVLEKYETLLGEQIEEKEKILENNSENTAVKEELSWLKEELAQVQEKRRRGKISIGELEKLEAVVADQKYDDPLMNELNQKEVKLQNELNDPTITKKEKVEIEKELAQVQKEQATQEAVLINKEIVQEKNESSELVNALKSTSNINDETQLTARTALYEQNSLEQEVEELIVSANSSKSPEEKNYYLNEALNKQEKANDLVQEAIVENTMQQLEEINGIESLDTKASLEVKKRRFSIQVGELTREIKEMNYELTVAKKSEVAELTKQRDEKIEQKNLVQKQLDAVTEQLNATEEIPVTLSPEAMKQDVTLEQEQEIASSDAYRNYEEKASAALQVEKQITNLEAELIKERSFTKQLVLASINEPSEENKVKLQENLDRIKEMEDSKKVLKEELLAKQLLAQEALPNNTEESMKMQNLVKRGIQPISKLALLAALVPMPANGLEIKTDGAAVYSAEKPIPVDVKSPTGLVYRVQVGAFAKPIPQDMFKQFNPVSGEKLNNGITRYMAGYFNNSTRVIDAKNQIKALGYADAFAVAYCDGKRISLAEARILEANGECVALGENELLMDVAANTALKMELNDTLLAMVDDTLKNKKVVNYTYNQAEGAVKAEPIEKHMGLFYTVQVGVYNNPVNAMTLNNIQSLMTVRLPNGQIRYTAGLYTNVQDALPKKQEALDKGVVGAFITAYYKGERITLAEAQRLINEKGRGVIEKNNLPKESATAVVQANVQTNNATVGTNVVSNEPITVEEKMVKAQIVTKKTFDEFPREILNRYNSHGSFYYDEKDKKVKSAIANSVDELPQVYYFKDDIDTLLISNELDIPESIVTVKFNSTSLPGDFTDWLLRYNYRREFIQSEEAIELLIHGVPDDKLEELKGKLELFGLTYLVTND